MNEQDATRLVERMYARHGKTPKPEWVAELVTEILVSSCHACAKAAVEAAMNDGPSPLTVPRFRFAFRGRYASDFHSPHVMATDLELEVGEVERFWHGEAVSEIQHHVGGDLLLAQLISALMWASQTIPPIRSMVADEMQGPLAPAGGHLWQANAARHGEPTEVLIEAQWSIARRIATIGYARWFDEEKLSVASDGRRKGRKHGQGDHHVRGRGDARD